MVSKTVTLCRSTSRLKHNPSRNPSYGQNVQHMFYESSLILIRMFLETLHILICNRGITRRCCFHCTERDILVSVSRTGFDCPEMCLPHRSFGLIPNSFLWELFISADIHILFPLKASFTDACLHTNTNGESHPIKPNNSRCLHSCPVQQGSPAAHLRRALSHKNLLSLSLYTHVFPQHTAPHLPLMSAHCWPQRGTSPPFPTAVHCIPPAQRLKNAKNEACCGA